MTAIEWIHHWGRGKVLLLVPFLHIRSVEREIDVLAQGMTGRKAKQTIKFARYLETKQRADRRENNVRYN